MANSNILTFYYIFVPHCYKIVLNKGLWRIDYVSLTNIKDKISPLEIAPTTIINNGKLDKKSISEINDPNKYLISMSMVRTSKYITKRYQLSRENLLL